MKRRIQSNIKSDFSIAGIQPIDKGKQPANRFDPRLPRKQKVWKEAGINDLNWDELASDYIDDAIPIDTAPNNTHEKDDQVAIQSSSTNTTQSFSETDYLSMTQSNDTSSPIPAKNQKLNEKEFLLKHIEPFPQDPPLEKCNCVPNG